MTMQRHTYVVTLSTGATVTRSPQPRTGQSLFDYRRAIEVTRPDGTVEIASWHSSITQANDQAHMRRVRGHDRTVRILPVAQLDYYSDTARAARAAQRKGTDR